MDLLSQTTCTDLCTVCGLGAFMLAVAWSCRLDAHLWLEHIFGFSFSCKRSGLWALRQLCCANQSTERGRFWEILKYSSDHHCWWRYLCCLLMHPVYYWLVWNVTWIGETIFCDYLQINVFFLSSFSGQLCPFFLRVCILIGVNLGVFPRKYLLVQYPPYFSGSSQN